MIRRTIGLGAILLGGLILFGPLCFADTLLGRVIGISDGDTLTLLQANQVQRRIRLAQIDAPEKTQAYGDRSKQSLSTLVFGQTVRVETDTQDRYGRTVGTVFLQGLDINLEQVKRGMAWVYRRYAHDPLYLEAEETARTERAGLWQDPAPKPPWDYRHPDRNNSSVAPPNPPVSQHCDPKTRCRQFTHCEEALDWVRQCGSGALDGDGDGLPCEKLCSKKRRP